MVLSFCRSQGRNHALKAFPTPRKRGATPTGRNTPVLRSPEIEDEDDDEDENEALHELLCHQRLTCSVRVEAVLCGVLMCQQHLKNSLSYRI
jgi:hypothetical protein